jgi:hypothetical protein
MVKQENSLAVAAVSQRADALDALRGLAENIARVDVSRPTATPRPHF